MAKIVGTPTSSFKIWEVLEDADDRRTLAHRDPEIDKWRSRVNEHPVGCSTKKQVPKMTKFPRRCVSKERTDVENPKKTPDNLKIPAETPKAPLKPRRAAKKLDGVPKRLEFPEAEDENVESIDSGFVGTQACVNHRYPTRLRVSTRATQNHDENQPKSSSAKAAKSKRNKNLSDLDKENDSSATNGAEPRQGTSTNNKKRSGLPVHRLGSQNVAIPEDLDFTRKQPSECSSADWIEHMRWLQQQRDVGLWVECCREGCGKWRYVEKYHDPLDVPKQWFCEMNIDVKFANCSIPEAEVPEAEAPYVIENAYNAGSIVWAKINGYPWWPAMVADCPQLLRYFGISKSSVIPYKYHVKFFNEMTRAWIPVKNLKPYAENPRITFLKRKKIIFEKKDYTEELDAACDLTDQALRLSLRQRFEKFSWIAQYSGDVCEERGGLTTEGIPPKKKKSTDDTKKRPAKKNLTRIAKKTVPKNKTINVRSRIVDVEKNCAVNREPSNSQSIWKMRITAVPRLPSRPNETSILEPDELFKENSNVRGEVDNSNIDDVIVPNPPLKSTWIQDLASPMGSWEKRKSTEPANSESCTERTPYNIGRKTLQKSELDAMSPRDRINLMFGYQGPSLSEEIRTGRSDDANEATRSSDGSESNVFAGTDEPAASQWEPIEIDLTDDSSDSEYFIRRSSQLHGEGSVDESEEEIFADTLEPSALTSEPILVNLTDSDHEKYPESPSTFSLSDLTFASTSTEFNESFGTIAPSSQPDQDKMYERLPRFPGVCARFGESSVSTHPSPEDVRLLTTASWESKEAFSLRQNSANNSEPSDLTFASTVNEFCPLNIRRSSMSRNSGESSGSIVSSSQPEQDELYEQLPRFPVLCVGFGESSVSTHPSTADVRLLITASWESEEAFSLRQNSEWRGKGFGNEFEVNISVGTVEPSASTTEPILIDISDSCMDDQGYYDRQEYLNYPNHPESRTNSEPLDLTFASTVNEFCPLNIQRSPMSRNGSESSGSIVSSSQPEQDELYERLPRFPVLCLGFRHPSISMQRSPVDFDFGSPARLSSQNLIEEIIIYD